MTRLIFLSCGVVALGLISCGGDDEGGGNGGPDGGAGTSGTGGAGLTGGAGGATGGTAGGSTGGATGGSGGGIAGGGSGGTPGTGGTAPDGGGGTAPDGGGGTAPDSSTGGGTGDGGFQPPTDGSQGAACSGTMTGDSGTGGCDMGLACYTFGGYCSAECTGDPDCSSLPDFTYTCFLPGGGGTGVCRVECMDAMDTNCPDGMSCIDVGGGSFRCAYTGSAAAFEPCQATSDCAAGLTCVPAAIGGYCAQTGCMMDTDCTEQPTSGTLTPTCSGFGPCVLDCAADMTGCPDMMTCTPLGGGGIAFCGF